MDILNKCHGVANVEIIIVSIILWLLATATGAFLFWRKRQPQHRQLLIIIGLASFILGATLFTSRIKNIISDLSHGWKTAGGEILEARIAGRRAFHPEIIYGFQVGGRKYTGKTDLDMPGFGGKRNRLETSEIIIADYPTGKKVKVYYNPADPAESRLHPGITYNIYIQLVVGIILMTLGLFLFLSILGRKIIR